MDLDLVALACHEVGLDDFDLGQPNIVEQLEIVQEAIKDASLPCVQLNDELGPVTVVWEGDVWNEDQQTMSRELAFGGDLTNTVFTNEEGTDIKIFLRRSPEQILKIKPHVSKENMSPSPVETLYSQKKMVVANVPKRTPAYKAVIKGAPCRKLPELKEQPPNIAPIPNSYQTSTNLNTSAIAQREHFNQTNTKLKTNASSENSNPFLDLFNDSQPGKVAFAYYVTDCWTSYGGWESPAWGGVTPGPVELNTFLQQCWGWWQNLPTPHRRNYWTKERDYYIEKRKQYNWPTSSSSGILSAMKPSLMNSQEKRKLSPVSETSPSKKPMIGLNVLNVPSSDEGLPPPSENSTTKLTSSSFIKPDIKKEDNGCVAIPSFLYSEQQYSNYEQITSDTIEPIKLKRPRGRPRLGMEPVKPLRPIRKDPLAPKKTKTAFLFFNSKYKKCAFEEMRGSSVGEVTRELSIRWKNLSQDEMMEFIELENEDQIRYNREIEEYRKSGGDESWRRINEFKMKFENVHDKHDQEAEDAEEDGNINYEVLDLNKKLQKYDVHDQNMKPNNFEAINHNNKPLLYELRDNFKKPLTREVFDYNKKPLLDQDKDSFLVHDKKLPPIHNNKQLLDHNKKPLCCIPTVKISEEDIEKYAVNDKYILS